MAGGMLGGVAASDVIRSMMRAGFSHDEIYDVLTGTGLPGEQVQLLIDRVAAEFHGAGIGSRPSRLGAEVEKIFKTALGELQHVTLARMDSLTHQLELVKMEIEKLGRRVVELQLLVNRTNEKNSHRDRFTRVKRLEKSAR